MSFVLVFTALVIASHSSLHLESLLSNGLSLIPDYFCYCEVGFSERVIGDHIFTLVREGNTEYGCQVYE
jgi:hypothetical protein